MAVVFMVLWHCADAWTLPSERNTLAFDVVRFFAGWAAPLFLFLAGVAVPLAGDARLARGVHRSAASWALQKRGWQVFLLAHLFRLQSFLLNPYGIWSSILKPDILNILGLGLVITAVLWKRARNARKAAIWLLGPAAACVMFLTPLSREWWWPTLLHPRFEAYIRPVGNFGVFSLFPTIGYVLVGGFAGVLLSRHREAPGRIHRALGAMGAALIATGAAGTLVPALAIPTTIESTPFFLWRTGAMILGLASAWAVFSRFPLGRRGPIVLLGQTSFFVYWIHVEMAYGVLSMPLHRRLPLEWALVALAVFGVLLFVLVRMKDRFMSRGRSPEAPGALANPLRSTS